VTWDTAVSLVPQSINDGNLSDDHVPVWTLDTVERWFPSYIYFSRYVQAHSLDGYVAGPEKALWIGTSGLDGLRNTFAVDVSVPQGVAEGMAFRLYVQGLTDHGEILPWERCVFAEVKV